eukprot:173821-Prymnesium_polylepis.1
MARCLRERDSVARTVRTKTGRASGFGEVEVLRAEALQLRGLVLGIFGHELTPLALPRIRTYAGYVLVLAAYTM